MHISFFRRDTLVRDYNVTGPPLLTKTSNVLSRDRRARRTSLLSTLGVLLRVQNNRGALSAIASPVYYVLVTPSGSMGTIRGPGQLHHGANTTGSCTWGSDCSVAVPMSAINPANWDVPPVSPMVWYSFTRRKISSKLSLSAVPASLGCISSVKTAIASCPSVGVPLALALYSAFRSFPYGPTLGQC